MDVDVRAMIARKQGRCWTERGTGSDGGYIASKRASTRPYEDGGVRAVAESLGYRLLDVEWAGEQGRRMLARGGMD